MLFTVACRLFSDFSIDSDHQRSLNSEVTEAKEFIPSFQATGEYKTEKNGKLEPRYLKVHKAGLYGQATVSITSALSNSKVTISCCALMST